MSDILEGGTALGLSSDTFNLLGSALSPPPPPLLHHLQ